VFDRATSEEGELKVVAGLGEDFGVIAERARRMEGLGYDALATAELAHDPFLPLMLAAEHTSRARLLTSIAVAFSRNPMTLANIGHDLQAFSKGRFTLGLGSQIKPHITKRFSMPWSSPAARMKEMVQALQAIWDCWYDEKPLNFEGEFYTHTLMTPRFTPLDTAFGRPRVIVAAVGPLMTRTAAEVADGMICHAFTTERYMREVTLPMVEQTLADSGRARADFEITYPPFVLITDDDHDPEAGLKNMRQMIAFYASTPAYRGVLELHGWGDLQSALHPMSKAGRWVEMGDLIDDAVLNAFAIVGDATTVAAEILRRYGGLVDTTHLDLSRTPGDQAMATIRTLQAGG
jgi:probable F420-dependent oxidoreductase